MTFHRVALLLTGTMLTLAPFCSLSAQVPPTFSIYDLRYSSDGSGDSPQSGNFVDCVGGIVTYESSPGSTPRLILQDPATPDGWGAIVVKSYNGSILVDTAKVGDYVSLTNVLVKDVTSSKYRGNTTLEYDNDTSGLTVVSSDNPLPAPTVVSLSEIAPPVEDPADYWLVADRTAEKYESMWLTVTDVTVTAMDLGKNEDNYNLAGAAGNVWASDYLHAGFLNDYDPSVSMGQEFESVTGILEQYTKNGSSYGWDYYQLLTTSSDNLVVPEPSTGLMLAIGTFFLFGRRRKHRSCC